MSESHNILPWYSPFLSPAPPFFFSFVCVWNSLLSYPRRFPLYRYIKKSCAFFLCYFFKNFSVKQNDLFFLLTSKWMWSPSIGHVPKVHCQRGALLYFKSNFFKKKKAFVCVDIGFNLQPFAKKNKIKHTHTPPPHFFLKGTHAA